MKNKSLRCRLRPITTKIFALLLLLFAILRGYYFTDDTPKREAFFSALQWANIHTGLQIGTIAYPLTIYLGQAVAAISYFIIAGTLWAAARRKEADYAAFAISFAVLGALSTNAGYIYYLASAIALLIANLRIPREKRMLAALARQSGPISIALALTAFLVAVIYPFLVDVHLGSSTWTHYKKVQNIFEGGIPATQDSFPDKRFTAYPPLSHYSLAFAEYASGLSFAEALRYLYIIFGVATLAGAYALAKKMDGAHFAALGIAYIGLMSKFVTAPAYGNYAQLASNVFAMGSLLLMASFLGSGKRKHLYLSAALLALTILTHWLLAGILTATYVLCLAAKTRDFKLLLGFFAIAFLPIAAYFTVLLLKGILLPQELLWAAESSSPNQQFQIMDTVLPISGVGPAYSATFGFGLLGLALAARDRRFWLATAGFAVSFGGYLLLSHYLTFFYPYRLTYYAAFFFSFFIAYGIVCAMRSVQEKGNGLVLLGVLALTVASGVSMQLGYLHRLSISEQPLAGSDLAAIMWVKENLNKEDLVASDALREENLYAYTSARAATPAESLRLLELSGTTDAFAYITLNGSSCNFPCTDAIQINKDKQLKEGWSKISPAETARELEMQHKKVFSEKGTYIYRLTGQ